MVMTYSATEKTGEQDYQGNVATYTYDRTYVALPRARGGTRRGRTPGAAHRAWGAWTIVVTSVPPTLLSLRDALVVLRALADRPALHAVEEPGSH